MNNLKKHSVFEKNIAESIVEIDTLENPHEILLGGRTCYKSGCGRISEDDCKRCGKPVCRTHGRAVGDYFYCRECS